MGEQKEQRGISHSLTDKAGQQKKLHPLLIIVLILVGFALFNALSENSITGFMVFSDQNLSNESTLSNESNESTLSNQSTFLNRAITNQSNDSFVKEGVQEGEIPILQTEPAPASSPAESTQHEANTSDFTLQPPEFFPQICVGPSPDCDAACGVGLGYKDTVSQSCFTDAGCSISCGGANAPPNVTQVLPINGQTKEPDSKMNISATVTDSGTISIVYVNISRPRITLVYRINLSAAGSNYSNSYTVHNITGQYNLTYFANDTSGASNKSITTRFNVTDTLSPPVTDPKPSPAAKTVQVDTTIAVGANATDPTNVSGFPLPHANITRPNVSQVYTLNLTQQGAGGGINFSKSYRVRNISGLHNITFFFKDNFNNINKTITTSITAVDTVGPIVSDSTPLHSQSRGINVSVNLSINATDALNISIVYANITRPGIVLPFRVNLSREGTTNNFSARYKIHNITGLYNITFFANDTRGNINFTNSTNISVTDTAAPSARYRAPVPQSTKEANASIGVSFNVSELVNVSTAYANITRPNISTIYRLNLTLGQASGPIRNMSASYLVQRTPGKYNFTFWANDLSGNILSSSTLNFTNITVQDTTAPGIIARGPTPQSSKEVNASLMVSWNLSEVVNISLAYVNVTRPNISTMYRLNVTL
ncbi:TPA: hypothetical protein HA253_01335, partial [Candidatus Woesearchaeota archaeon]|nr:hypothetical protein [Candidatus Woesearchaeota archaeon]